MVEVADVNVGADQKSVANHPLFILLRMSISSCRAYYSLTTGNRD